MKFTIPLIFCMVFAIQIIQISAFFEASYGANLDESPAALVGQSAGAQLAAAPGNPGGFQPWGFWWVSGRNLALYMVNIWFIYG